ncbi:MAG: Asp23/Gls24 family envelope stress response protein [Ruminococcaceae bacterium]|nr:Asp23/Gls24 family envelope stress response protein [Oscillospiraceae bacterium]
MAENKQYITHIQDNGTIMVSEDVIATIVAHAIKDVEGVVGLSTKAVAELADLIGKKNWGKGMKITVNEDNSVVIDCDIVIVYGQSVVAVAEAVQQAVISAVESTAGVPSVAVNVNVCGIMRQ